MALIKHLGFSGNVDQFPRFGGRASDGMSPIEPVVQIPCPRSGTVQNFRVFIPVNTFAAPVPLEIRKNGATLITGLIPPGFVGPMPIPGTGSVSKGDLMSVILRGSASPGGLIRISASYEIDSGGQITFMGIINGGSLGYSRVEGDATAGSSATGTESDVQVPLGKIGTLTNMFGNIVANTMDGVTDFHMRKNGVTFATNTVNPGITGPILIAGTTPIADLDLVSLQVDASASTVGQIAWSITPEFV